MTGRRLLALSALAVAYGCQDQLPTGPEATTRRSSIVSDGAHDGNPDFFFLPPLVKLNKHDRDFELGAFNNTLKSSLRVEICELEPERSNRQRLPIDATACAATVKTFGSAAIQLVNLPAGNRHIPKEFRHEDWWKKTPKRSSDGFYYVLWDTRRPDLKLDKYYRIKVLIGGSTPGSGILLGFVDVDPQGKGGPKWKHSRSREVIEMVDNTKLPIPFRVENEGAFCSGAEHCTSVTVPNDNPDGDATVVTIDGGVGAIAGVSFPDGWLRSGGNCTPATCPQEVVVTITEVPSEETDAFLRTRTTPCHIGLPLQQFNKCFTFTTTPALPTIEGRQFARDVLVAVCYALEGTGDPCETFVELYTSGPDEETEALEDESDEGILGGAARNCTTRFAGLESTNPLTRFASTGWRKLKGGLGLVFGVKTAYAVDVGLGGLVKRFSNIGPALSAEIEAFPEEASEGPTQLSLESGVAIARARIVGTHVHAGDDVEESHGLNKVPVTFSVISGNGTLSELNTEGDEPSVTVITSFLSNLEEDGIASVEWTPPTVPGTYHMRAEGPTTDGPVEFSVTVPLPVIGLAPTERRMLSMQTGARIQLAVAPPNTIAGWTSSDASKVQVTSTGLATALVGGESIVGGADVSLTSTLGNQSPGPSLLVNSFSFDLFPRITTLAWNGIAGAVSYFVVTEHGNASVTDPFCSVPVECGLWAVTESTTTSALSFTFQFVGSQPGRWRVFARNASGAVIHTSAYVYFDYDV